MSTNFVAECTQEWLHHKAWKQESLQTLKSIGAGSNVADYFEHLSTKYAGLPAIVSVEQPDKAWTYAMLDKYANRVAHWALEVAGLKQGDCVALMMENRVEFPAFTIGLAKVGVTTALINFNLAGRLLSHAIDISRAVCVVTSPSHADSLKALDVVKAVYVLGSEALDLESSAFSETRPSKELRNQIQERDPFVYIFTSGTTGASKAAIFSHRRFIGCGLTWALPSNLKQGDCYYIPLPIYHGNGGAVALSSIFLTGGCAVLRKKFSASNFFSDIRTFNCKTMVYVGELWRYIHSLPESPLDKQHPLETVVGNGLRPEIWPTLKSRFGIKRIVEHYGSTEMPGDAVIQWFGKVGSCGFVPHSEMKAYGGVVIKFDIGAGMAVKNSNTAGWAVQCGANERGELIMPLPDGKYDGYVDETQTEKKLYRNVFELGDLWFSTGDILKFDEDGFFYFVDRTGDSFRWKGENVATTEVAEVVSLFPGVSECNVYGVSVPGYDGKAGMAALSAKPELNLKALSEHVTKQLPAYSVPMFIRLCSKEAETTSTLKYQKHLYSAQGFDIDAIKDDRLFLYDRTKGEYVPLARELYDRLVQGTFRL